ncbi:MAG: ATP-binding cassette domain-containing protein [Pirellulaceae bacterium]|nr:ATP-binding cassette domain-containing protein [Pirellulaceae bacterium]
MTLQNVLQVQSLTSGYRNRVVLQGISLDVCNDNHIAIIGANGCGKSTLLRTIMNLVPSTTGEISFRETQIERMPTDQIVRIGIGYLKQTENVFRQLSVRDNLSIASGAKALAGERAEFVLDCFPVVRNRLKVRAGLLSGGQRQSLALAMVLMRPVSLLLLDEPIAGLSPSAASELMHSLESLKSRFSFASVIVEHRLRRIEPLVNRLIVMRNGEIIDDTTDTQLMLDASWLDERYRHVPT